MLINYFISIEYHWIGIINLFLKMFGNFNNFFPEIIRNTRKMSKKIQKLQKKLNDFNMNLEVENRRLPFNPASRASQR